MGGARLNARLPSGIVSCFNGMFCLIFLCKVYTQQNNIYFSRYNNNCKNKLGVWQAPKMNKLYGMAWYMVYGIWYMVYGIRYTGYGMAWHGMAWHGMAWHGMAWHGMAWHDMT